MYHSNTTALLNYWRDLRGQAFAPTRQTFDPIALRDVLTQVFMLGRLGPSDFRFRLAGGVLCDAHRQNLRGLSFAALWADEDRLHIKLALEAMVRTGEPVVVNASADAGPFATSIEVLLAPLLGPEGQTDRVLGFFQPLLPLSVLHDRPIDRLSVSRIVKAFDLAQDSPRLRLAAVSGRLIGA